MIRVRYLDEFRALISKRWEEGYALIDVEDSRGVLVWVFAKGSKVKREAYDIVEDWRDVKGVVEGRWKSGLHCKNIENVSDGWFCIFTDEDAGEESYIFNEKFYNFKHSIKKQWDKDMNLINITYGRD